MDPPPPPPQTPPISTNTTAPATAATHNPYPDSLDSSPRSRTTDSWDDPVPPSTTTTAPRIRLMCSYGGHIVPRPHDKSLCYVGGDTRIVVIDRQSSLSDLHHRLSKSLHHHLRHTPFLLKYQLPNEDLDSLISLTTDEDFDNMLDEYDRTTSSAAASSKPSRLRLFVFPLKPESSQSVDIGEMLDSSTKSSEDWFLSALNGAGLLSSGFSDSTSVNCLLDLNDGGAVLNNRESGARDSEVSQAGSFGNCKNLKQGQDVHSVPDSPMLETTSSFGSTSSSPSLANLPPIRVHMEDQKAVAMEEQFAQMSVGVGGGGGFAGPKQEEGFVVLSSPPPIPPTISVSAVPVTSAAIPGDYSNRVISDDERSDHGAPVGYRKQQQPQTVPQSLPPQSKSSGGGLEVPSPDSVSSDSSLSNSINRPKPMIYQDPVVQIPSGNTRIAVTTVDSKVNMSDPSARVQMQQQVQDSGYILQPQFEHQQQQFIHPSGAHYIQHHPAGAVPFSPYYPIYPPQQQQHHHQQLNQQYPMYYVPARQAQAYNLSVQQSNINEAATGIPSSRPQAPPSNPTMAPPAAYNPIRNAPIAKPEMAAGMYRTATTGAPQLVQMPSNQHQQQFVGFSQIHHPPQSAVPTSAASANYGYEFADPSHAQIYYTQPLAPTLPSQYQTMTAAAAANASAQLPADNSKQQNRTS